MARKLATLMSATAALALSACSVSSPTPIGPILAPPPVVMPPPVMLPLPFEQGSFFYLGVGNTAGGLYKLRNGTLTRVVADTSLGFFQSAAVNRDGTRVAYVLADSVGSTGQVRVIELRGGGSTLGPNTVSNVTPLQFVGNSKLYLAYGSDLYGELDLTTGAANELVSASNCCVLLIADGGQLALVRRGTTSTVVRLTDFSDVHTVHAPPGMQWVRIQSMSSDGRYAAGILRAAGEGPIGDAGRLTGSNAIVDISTGVQLPVPGGGTLLNAWFQSTGVVIRADVSGVKQIRLVRPESGSVLGQISEPVAATDLELIAFAGEMGSPS